MITLKKLEALRACESQIEMFREHFGNTAPMTIEAAVAVAPLFDWGWAAEHLLKPRWRKAYNEAIATAQNAYDEAVAPARKAYIEAIATAWKARDEAVAPARKAYFEVSATAQNAYDEATATALEAYDAVAASAQKAYIEAAAPALEAYAEALARAFAEAYIAQENKK